MTDSVGLNFVLIDLVTCRLPPAERSISVSDLQEHVQIGLLQIRIRGFGNIHD